MDYFGVLKLLMPQGRRLMADAQDLRPPDGGLVAANPYFVRYMIREGSSVFLAIYALILLVGLCRAHAGRGGLGRLARGADEPRPPSCFTGSRC